MEKISVNIESSSAEAQQLGKDIYELTVTSDNGQSLTLYDFTKLRCDVTGNDLVPSGGSYGRVETVAEFVKAIISRDASVADLVTVEQARKAQLIIATMKQIKP